MKESYEIRLSKGAVRDLKKMEQALRDFLYNKLYEIFFRVLTSSNYHHLAYKLCYHNMQKPRAFNAGLF